MAMEQKATYRGAPKDRSQRKSGPFTDAVRAIALRHLAEPAEV
jgi:acyl-CoA thioester hydrolase